MNPFNWTGPEFLLFYVMLAIGLILAQIILRRSREAEAPLPAQTPQLTDPYLVSYLAGGANGLLRCVMVALLERNLLRPAGGKNKEVEAVPGALGQTNSPIEAAVVQIFNQPRAAWDVFKTVSTGSVGQNYQESLEQAGLLPNAEQRQSYLRDALVVALILLSVAGVKVALALERGHKNVAFLIILAILSSIVSLVVSKRRLTRQGREALVDLKNLFGGLRDKAKNGQPSISPADVAFVSAVFGVAALGGARQMYAKELFPAASSSSGCGSGCGSSSSSDGGGGGGCGGGGCGGCGGG
jgi:uncharacterized protein (TIGR04222 family)